MCSCCAAPLLFGAQHHKVRNPLANPNMSQPTPSREAEWYKLMYDELLKGNVGTDGSKPVLLKEDNQSCVALAKNFIASKRTKHIRIRLHYVRQQLRDCIIEMEYSLRSQMTTLLIYSPR